MYSENLIDFASNDYLGFAGDKKIFKKAGQIKIFASKINIAPYPNSSNRKLFLVFFNEKYHSKNYNWQGKKTLMVEIKNGQFYILLEK